MPRRDRVAPRDYRIVQQPVSCAPGFLIASAAGRQEKMAGGPRRSVGGADALQLHLPGFARGRPAAELRNLGGSAQVGRQLCLSFLSRTSRIFIP